MRLNDPTHSPDLSPAILGALDTLRARPSKDVDTLRSAIDARLSEVHEAAVERFFVDDEVAEQTAMLLRGLVDGLGDAPREDVREWVQAAVDYFCTDDDDDGDTDSVWGFDDDLAVATEVTHLVQTVDDTREARPDGDEADDAPASTAPDGPAGVDALSAAQREALDTLQTRAPADITLLQRRVKGFANRVQRCSDGRDLHKARLARRLAGLAVRLLARMRLLDDRDPQRALLQAAVEYLVEPDDALPDEVEGFGLDDDREVLEAVWAEVLAADAADGDAPTEDTDAA